MSRGGGRGSGADVAMATEPVAVEPTVPSLVDRYFTRWYKPGKWGVSSVSRQPRWPDAIGTRATHQKLRVLSPALHPHIGRNWTSLLPASRREWAFAKTCWSEM